MNDKLKNQHSRRDFLRDASQAATGFFIVPRHVLGRGFIAPSDRLAIAAIGAGGKGGDDLKNFFGSGKVDVVALCWIVTETPRVDGHGQARRPLKRLSAGAHETRRPQCGPRPSER